MLCCTRMVYNLVEHVGTQTKKKSANLFRTKPSLSTTTDASRQPFTARVPHVPASKPNRLVARRTEVRPFQACENSIRAHDLSKAGRSPVLGGVQQPKQNPSVIDYVVACHMLVGAGCKHAKSKTQPKAATTILTQKHKNM